MFWAKKNCSLLAALLVIVCAVSSQVQVGAQTLPQQNLGKSTADFGWYGTSAPFQGTYPSLSPSQLAAVARQSPLLAALGDSRSAINFVGALLTRWFRYEPDNFDNAPFQVKQEGFNASRRSGIRVTMTKTTIFARCSDTYCLSGSLIAIGKAPLSVANVSSFHLVPLLLMQTVEAGFGLNRSNTMVTGRAASPGSQEEGAETQVYTEPEDPTSSGTGSGTHPVDTMPTARALPAFVASTLVPGPLYYTAKLDRRGLRGVELSSIPVIESIVEDACHFDSVIGLARTDDLAAGTVDASCVVFDHAAETGKAGFSSEGAITALILNTNQLHDTAATSFINSTKDAVVDLNQGGVCIPDIYLIYNKKKFEIQLSYRVPPYLTQMHLRFSGFCSDGFTRALLQSYKDMNLMRIQGASNWTAGNDWQSVERRFFKSLRVKVDDSDDPDLIYSYETELDTCAQVDNPANVTTEYRKTMWGLALSLRTHNSEPAGEGTYDKYYKGAYSAALWTSLAGPVPIRSTPRNLSWESTSATTSAQTGMARGYISPNGASGVCLRQWHYDLSGSAGPELELTDCAGGPGPSTHYALGLDPSRSGSEVQVNRTAVPGGPKLNGTLQWQTRCTTRTQQMYYLLKSAEGGLVSDVDRIVDSFGGLYGETVTMPYIMLAVSFALYGSVVAATNILPLAAWGCSYILDCTFAKRLDSQRVFVAATFLLAWGGALGAAVPLATVLYRQLVRVFSHDVFDISSNVVLASPNGLKFVAHSYIEARVEDEKSTLLYVIAAYFLIVIVTACCIGYILRTALVDARPLAVRGGDHELRNKPLRESIVVKLYETPASRSLRNTVDGGLLPLADYMVLSMREKEALEIAVRVALKEGLVPAGPTSEDTVPSSAPQVARRPAAAPSGLPRVHPAGGQQDSQKNEAGRPPSQTQVSRRTTAAPSALPGAHPLLQDQFYKISSTTSTSTRSVLQDAQTQEAPPQSSRISAMRRAASDSRSAKRIELMAREQTRTDHHD